MAEPQNLDPEVVQKADEAVGRVRSFFQKRKRSLIAFGTVAGAVGGAYVYGRRKGYTDALVDTTETAVETELNQETPATTEA